MTDDPKKVIRVSPNDYPDDHPGWALLFDAVVHGDVLCGRSDPACRRQTSRDMRVSAIAERLPADVRDAYLRWAS